MARKFSDRYVRFYTVGSAAAKVEQPERRASLPNYQKTEPKRKPIPVDPFAFLGSAMAIFLAVLMLVRNPMIPSTATTHTPRPNRFWR